MAEILLIQAAQQGKLEEVRRLLIEGRDVNKEYPRNGFTALNHAVMHGHFEIASLLIEYGARIDRQDKKGKTALDIARERNRSSCVAILQIYEHFHRYRKDWLSFSTSLRSFQDNQNQESKQKQNQTQIRSPSLMRVMDSSDLVRYLTEFM